MAHGLGVEPRRRFVRTTDRDHHLPVFPNLCRNVIPAGPGAARIGDITCIRRAAGLCYLAVLLDACSRRVVGYAISREIDTQLTLAALEAAAGNRHPPREAPAIPTTAVNTPARSTAPHSSASDWSARRAG